nr:MAG TPA: hypothetical protein [Caudoviricetes sp.]
MTKYVILKKIDNTWYATRNRYTTKELEIIVDKHYNDVVDFEALNDGDYQGLDDGVIIVKDDGRELDKNGKYLNDDLKLETNKELEKGLNLLVGMPIWFMGIFTNIMSFDTALLLMFIWVALVHFAIVPNINNNKENTKDLQEENKKMQVQLKEDHKAIGMM